MTQSRLTSQKRLLPAQCLHTPGLVSELDEERYETRKLEFFANGRVGFASSETSSEGTMLGVAPLPPLSEINSDPQFSGLSIGSADFGALWNRHARNT